LKRRRKEGREGGRAEGKLKRKQGDTGRFVDIYSLITRDPLLMCTKTQSGPESTTLLPALPPTRQDASVEPSQPAFPQRHHPLLERRVFASRAHWRAGLDLREGGWKGGWKGGAVKASSFPSSHLRVQVGKNEKQGGRERRKKGRKEGEREKGRKGGREGERKEEYEGGREGKREERREGGREGGRDAPGS